eukprot:gene4988-9967_t
MLEYDSDDFDPGQFDPEFLTFDDDFLQFENTDAVMRRILNNRQQSQPQSLLRDGKLYLSISGTGQNPKMSSIFGIPHIYTCSITMDDITRSITFSPNKDLNNNPKIIVFDIFEYYGQSPISLSVSYNGFFSTKYVGSKSITLHDIIMRQDKTEVQKRRLHSTDASPLHTDYWGCHAMLNLDHPINTSNTNTSQKKSNISKFKLHLCARFVPLQKCLMNLSIGNMRFTHGYNELQYAVSYGTTDVVKDLLDTLSKKTVLRKALNCRSFSGLSVLECAIRHKNKDVIRLLLQRAGSYCFQGTNKRSSCALHHAILSDEVITLQLLLRFLTRYISNVVGWEGFGSIQEALNWRDANDLTPLMLCATRPSTGTSTLMAGFLISAGADLSLKTTTKKQNALMLAAKEGSTSICRLLLEQSHTSTSMQLIPGQQNVPLALLKCGPAERDINDMQAILYAVENGHKAILDMLLDFHVPFDIPNSTGNSCLHLAAMKGYSDICNTILEAEKKIWKLHITNDKSASLKRMQFRAKFLLVRNHRGKRASEVATEAGYPVIARSIDVAAMEIYGHGQIGEELQRGEGNPTATGDVDYEADELDYTFALAKKPHGNSYRMPVLQFQVEECIPECSCEISSATTTTTVTTPVTVTVPTVSTVSTVVSNNDNGSHTNNTMAENSSVSIDNKEFGHKVDLDREKDNDSKDVTCPEGKLVEQELNP